MFQFSVFILPIESKVLKTSRPTTRSCWQLFVRKERLDSLSQMASSTFFHTMAIICSSLWLAWNHTTWWSFYDFNVIIFINGTLHDLTVFINRHIWLWWFQCYLYGGQPGHVFDGWHHNLKWKAWGIFYRTKCFAPTFTGRLSFSPSRFILKSNDVCLLQQHKTWSDRYNPNQLFRENEEISVVFHYIHATFLFIFC